MSLSVLEPTDAWRSFGDSEPALLATILPMRQHREVPRSIERSVDALQLRASLEVEGLTTYPPQQWSAVFTDCGAVFENYPEHGWPRILIEFQTDKPLGPSRVEAFFSRLPESKISQLIIRPSEDTVSAEVLYTRVLLSLDRARRSSFRDLQAGVLFSLKHEGLSDDDREEAIDRAKLHRKLMFIQTVFGTQFLLPVQIPADEVRLAETVFQGVSTGVSVIRGSDITVTGVIKSDIDLKAPPFIGPGEFRRVVSWHKKWVGLLGRTLDVGPVTLVLKAAEIADPRIIDQMLEAPEREVDLRFVVYDHQISHRFERYAKAPMKKRLRRLNSFKQRLALEESRELAELVSQPLSRDVTRREAIQIALGWLSLNRLPDRYCPQDPELEQEAHGWRVPILVAYANGKSGQVGELLIDSVKGNIIHHTPLDELRASGALLAETLVHV